MFQIGFDVREHLFHRHHPNRNVKHFESAFSVWLTAVSLTTRSAPAAVMTCGGVRSPTVRKASLLISPVEPDERRLRYRVRKTSLPTGGCFKEQIVANR